MARINKSVAASQHCVIKCVGEMGEGREEMKRKRNLKNGSRG
jgi:hypothetical protein